MFAASIVVFREVLEMALIVSCVMASTKGLAGRIKYVGGGIGAGFLGALVVAGFAQTIAMAAAGVGQEIMNAAILFVAVAMLTWHVVWMGTHGKELAQKIKSMGQAILAGKRPLYILATMVGLAVLREGSEIVLFMHSLMAGGLQTLPMMIGGALGFGAGVLLGYAIYKGMVMIPLRPLFRITNILIVAIAAGMAAKGANYLVQADLLPALGQRVWDTSHILSEQSMLGKLLSVLVGYTARPTGIEILFYMVTIGTILLLLQASRRTLSFSVAMKTAGAAIVALIVIISSISPAHAVSTVKSPYVDKGEYEVELKYQNDNDDDSTKDQQEFVSEFYYSVTDWWKPSISFKWQDTDAKSTDFVSVAFENRFQLTERGEYWADWGFFTEYSLADNGNGADTIEGGPIMTKQIGDFVHTANLFFEVEVGANSNSTTEVEYRWQTKYRYSPTFQPAFEVFGKLGEVRNLSALQDQKHKAGPVLFGKIPGTTIVYQIGYLFALTNAQADGSFKTLFEYETYF